MKDIVFTFCDFTFSNVEKNIKVKYFENEYLDDEFDICETEEKGKIIFNANGNYSVTGKIPKKVESTIFSIIGNSHNWPFDENGKIDIFRIPMDIERIKEYNDTHCF